ncbi:MAG: thioredoxin [Candidatus Absconditabacteria bacterium]
MCGKEELVQQLNTNKLVLVDFWAPWCGPCRMLGPVLEKISEEMSSQVKVVKINVDEEQNQILAGEFGVSSIPQVTLIKNGNNVDQFIGALPYETIKEIISKNL